MASSPIVTTEYGIIEGFNHETADGFEAEIFLGVPYAKPPINELRFEKPQPPTKWKTPLKADKFGKPAIIFPARKFKDGDEDCLTLNLFKPKKTLKQCNPFEVMVYIHGGGFVSGSSREWGYKEVCRKLVSHGLIVVTLNYRLGPFGFFTTGDENIPGNYGIWDMIQALKFLQQILPSFNGDPSNVTLFGHSAGGMATSLLTLTPETKDLFARAIPMSGSALSKSSNNPFLIKHSKMVADALEIDFNSFRLRDELIEVSADQIKEAVKSFIPEMLRVDEVVLVHFSPRIDGDLFKEKTATQLVCKSDVSKPILMGLVDQEAILFAVNPFGKLATSGKYIWIHPDDIPNVGKSRFSDYVTQKLADKKIFGSSAKDYADAVINFYESNVKVSSVNNRYLTMLTQLISDVNFNIPALREAKLRAAAGQKVYFYLYTYINPKYKSQYFDAVAHADELPCFFDAPIGKANVEMEGEEGEVQKSFSELFINFARNGNAETRGLQLPPVTPEKIPFIKIDKELSLENNLWPERISFWNTLAEDFGFDWPSGVSTAHPETNILMDLEE